MAELEAQREGMLPTRRDDDGIRVEIPRANVDVKEYEEFLNEPPRRSQRIVN